MYAITDLQFWLAFIFFFIVVFISFFLPGFLILQRINKNYSTRNFLLAICVGFILWTMQGYVFGYLDLRWLTYVYVIIILVISARYVTEIKKIFLAVSQSIKRNNSVAFIIFFGMLLQSQIMFGSGFITSDGMHFLGVNNVDGIMHVGYIQKMMTEFPPNEPGAYLLPLKNYHYWMDLNIAELARIWMLSPHHLFYQFMPLLFSVITSAATYLLMKIWTGSKIAGGWALFFLFFGGDAAYLFMLFLQQTFGFHTPVIDNGMTQFYNMPHAAAKMIFMGGLLAFYYWIKTQKTQWGLITVLLFAPLVGLKVYFGIFAALGMSLVVLYKLVKSFLATKKANSLFVRSKNALRQQKSTIGLLLLFVIISAAIYFPPNAGAGGLKYYPLEWPKLFLGFQNLDIQEWWLRMQVYEEAGNTRNIIIFNTFAIIVALICIHGTRLIGLIPHKNLVKKLGWEHMLFFLPGIVIFHFLGLFTLQEAGSFNVYNFFIVSTVIMSLFAAYLLYELTLKKKWWAFALIIVIVILTVPRAVYESYTATKTIITQSGSLISSQELKALQYIRYNTPEDAIVQSHPQNRLDKTTPYVAYFTNRDAYVSGNGVIEAHAQPIHKLVDELEKNFAITNEEEFTEELRQKNISYLYLQKNDSEKLPVSYSSDKLKVVYENEEVRVLKVIE